MAVSFRESGNPPSPKRDDEPPLRRGLTTSNLRFAGRARNEGFAVRNTCSVVSLQKYYFVMI